MKRKSSRGVKRVAECFGHMGAQVTLLAPSESSLIARKFLNLTAPLVGATFEEINGRSWCLWEKLTRDVEMDWGIADLATVLGPSCCVIVDSTRVEAFLISGIELELAQVPAEDLYICDYPQIQTCLCLPHERYEKPFLFELHARGKGEGG